MKNYELKNAYDFLLDLKLNNNRQWFNENRKKYQTAKKIYESFIDDIIVAVKKNDKSIDVNEAKECMFRIFKDVRFSKNKDPYKTNFGAVIAKGGRKSPYAGYYLHFEPDNSFFGGGLFMPQANILKAIRNDIFKDSSKLKKIISKKVFIDTFSELHGDKLKTAPRGFPKDFKDIKLLNHKHFVVIHKVNNEFWFEPNLIDRIADIFIKQHDFNKYLNKIVHAEIVNNLSKKNLKNEEDFFNDNFAK